VAAGGAAWRHVADGLERLRDEIASDADVDAAMRALTDPATTITGPAIVTLRARR
jgi:hypothetical protein